jgi:hypothetical protein
MGGTLRAHIDDSFLIVADTLLDQPIARLDHPGQVPLATLSLDGRYAATLDEYGIVRIWALGQSQLIEQACSRGPRALGSEDWNRYMPSGALIDACDRNRAQATK